MITIHQRHRQTDGRTDRQTDVKRSHDRYIAKACSGKELYTSLPLPFSQVWFSNRRARWRKQTANNMGGAESDDVTLRHRPLDQSTLASELHHHTAIDKPAGK